MHCTRHYRPAVGSPATHLYLIPFICYKVGPPNTDRWYFQCALCCESLTTTGVTDHHPPLWLLPINEEDVCGALGPHQVGYVYQLTGEGRGGEGKGRGGEKREGREGEKMEGRRAGEERKGARKGRGVVKGWGRRGEGRRGKGRWRGWEGSMYCMIHNTLV